MKLRYILPLIYVVVSFVLIIPLGGAGHGWGVEGWYYVSLPVSLVLNLRLFDDPVYLWPVMLVDLVQYFLLGFLLERVITSVRSRPPEQ
ncbi:MAG: hypothetical protein ACREDR_03885 [Blastocatellia bacterium]